jgi:hypothetical protein
MDGKLKELKCLMENVPFGNSQFQIEAFIAGEETPERTYRTVLLQLNEKLNALQECKFRRKRLEIDMTELEEKIASSKNKFEVERAKVDLEEKQWRLDNEVKLINDCGFEIEKYQEILDKLPKFTREEFDAGEHRYWQNRLLDDAKRQHIALGYVDAQTIKSLQQVGVGIGKDEKNQLMFSIPKLLSIKQEAKG